MVTLFSWEPGKDISYTLHSDGAFGFLPGWYVGSVFGHSGTLGTAGEKVPDIWLAIERNLLLDLPLLAILHFCVRWCFNVNNTKCWRNSAMTVSMEGSLKTVVWRQHHEDAAPFRLHTGSHLVLQLLKMVTATFGIDERHCSHLATEQIVRADPSNVGRAAWSQETRRFSKSV